MSAHGLNQGAQAVFQNMCSRAKQLNVRLVNHKCGAQVLDCGVQTPGGLAAGLDFAAICLAAKASVRLTSGDAKVWPGPWVQVETDHPLEACMFGQYAGWPVKHASFFAMGSGPMRVRRGKEELLLAFAAEDHDRLAVGTLESDVLPSEEVVEWIAGECQVDPEDLHLAVAPTRSIAGCVQVVARSVETALHKLHELDFPLRQVKSAMGVAPLCPPAPDFATGIGRTNDAVLYGAQVSLWVEGDDEQIAEVGGRLPSSASTDYGRPFAEIFAGCDFDFYKIDPGLFSPAEVLLMNASSGRSWRFGSQRPDLISRSFATE
ncbi:MAG: methenyltetrahydromethanopterin cyclohydrolase [bacterium]|nr:methenyltetrahydromethanopterin cyclohydrolase [bacterium]